MAKKKKNITSKIYKILSFLLILISIIFLGSLIYCNILPGIYQFLVIGVIVVIDLILLILMLKTKKKKTGAFLSVVLMAMMSVGGYYVLRTAGLLNNLNLNYKIYNYSVVVLKNSDYSKLKDIEGEELGYYKTDGEECKASLNKLSKKVSTENKSYEEVEKMAGDLLNEDIQVMLVEDTYLDILNEGDGTSPVNGDASVGSDTTHVDISNFNNQTKVIYKFSIMVKTSDISKDLDVTKKPFSIYISGIDTYGSIASVSRSDVNMVVTVNPQTRQILLTSIPRDYYVQLHGKSGYPDKLTHAGLYGVDMSLQTIEDLLDIDINYYVKVNFTSIIDIVDSIGGVDVYSDYTFTSIDGYHYTEGYNKVDGKEALSFVRERKAFSEGDRQRIKDQQAMIEAIFRKCTSRSIITKYNSLLNSIDGSFVTNMPTDRLTSLIKMQISKKYKWTITANSLDGDNSSNYTYSYSSSKLYVMEPIEESIEYAKKLIDSVIDGEKLDPTYDGNASDVHSVTHGSKSSSSTSSSSSSKSSSIPKNNEGLKASLGRQSVTFNEGETYTYYPYSATYNGSTVTSSTSATFSVNGRTFSRYQDLVSYVSKLDAGSYNIVYKISYSGNSVSLSQSVTIKATIPDTPADDEDDSVIPNDDTVDGESNE